MKKLIPSLMVLLLMVSFLILSCSGRNIKFESQNVEAQTSRKSIKVNISNAGNVEPKHFVYLMNALNSKILSSTEFIPTESDNYDLIASVSVEKMSEVIVPNTNTSIVRIDIIGTIKLETISNEVIISNYSLTQTLITNISQEILYKSFLRDEFLDKVRYQIIDEFALNASSLMYKGWRENYGAYTTTNLIKTILGGSNETNTTKTKKRNIPTIGGE